MPITPSEFKKTYRVYAVVGAACANAVFRQNLFGAFDERSAEGLRSEVNRFLELTGDQNPIVTDDELALIWTFVCPRPIEAALAPPFQSNCVQRPQTTWTFEAACESFLRICCPHWPCDGAQ
jgi:hypothetical protein